MCTYVRIQVCVTGSADVDLCMYAQRCVYTYVRQAESTWTHSYVCMYMTYLHVCVCTYMGIQKLIICVYVHDMHVYVHTCVYSYVGQAVQSGRAGELLNRVTGVRKREGRLESFSYRVEMIFSFFRNYSLYTGKFF